MTGLEEAKDLVSEVGPHPPLRSIPPLASSSAVESEPRLTPVGWPVQPYARGSASGLTVLESLPPRRKMGLWHRIIIWMGRHPLERPGYRGYPW